MNRRENKCSYLLGRVEYVHKTVCLQSSAFSIGSITCKYHVKIFKVLKTSSRDQFASIKECIKMWATFNFPFFFLFVPSCLSVIPCLSLLMSSIQFITRQRHKCKKGNREKGNTRKKRNEMYIDITFSTSFGILVHFNLNQNFPLHFCFGKTAKHFFNKNIFLEKMLTPL